MGWEGLGGLVTEKLTHACMSVDSRVGVGLG